MRLLVGVVEFGGQSIRLECYQDGTKIYVPKLVLENSLEGHLFYNQGLCLHHPTRPDDWNRLTLHPISYASIYSLYTVECYLYPYPVRLENT